MKISCAKLSKIIDMYFDDLQGELIKIVPNNKKDS